MSKCQGCGSTLTLNPDKEGFTKSLDNKLCERCFRIRNYNEYKTVIKNNDEYYKIIDNIKEGLIVLVIDIFDIPYNLNDLVSHFKSKVLLVLTKFDLIPSNYDDRFINYFKDNYNINMVDTIVVSSKNNYQLDELYNKIRQYAIINKVYFVGFTNAGKSSIINKIIYNYSDCDTVITTSNLPSTTLNTIEIRVNDLILIDTPGIVNEKSMINSVEGNYLKKLIPSKKIKPITYQIKTKQSIVIEDWFQINCQKNNNLIFYFSDKLSINRYYKDKRIIGNKEKIFITKNSDIVIPGAGFIRVMNDDEFEIYIKDGVNYYIRNSIM